MNPGSRARPAGLAARLLLAGPLAGLLGLGACAGTPDAEQARICRRALPTLVPAGARVAVLREAAGPQERSIRIDFSQEREGRSPLPRYAVCEFSGLSRTDLSGLTSDRGPVGGAALYLLKHYYLDTPDAALAEPGAG
ncbi:hypothetical protein SAMN02799631_05213 [Methylobacterium sp. 174MFSha1.1]|uniref:hypothetical protein n=1 Tax=Methylobacterium sp. 174MFSha1.1 TaxID=1502749 RepID=UPI0008EC0136|nr:hypothetical protein [Methylobacterium sp. 174MFSha1.1]SFV11109.1 hypothetical protein SAMN02799631_05213 [Methylobacterium sp. 174MFSha1.1]